MWNIYLLGCLKKNNTILILGPTLNFYVIRYKNEPPERTALAKIPKSRLNRLMWISQLRYH